MSGKEIIKMKELSAKVRYAIKSAAKKLTGVKRRSYQAEITNEFFGGSARKAEQEMGWGRETVKKGLKESESGILCSDNFRGRGRKKTEEKLPTLENDIRDIAEPNSQTDPDFKHSILYMKITAKAVRETLIKEKGYEDEELPTDDTIGNILNRMGYTLKRVLKAKPVKKIPETDEIFENVHEANSTSDANPTSLRISIDSKAKVSIGNFSRNGESRSKDSKKADDHDMKFSAKSVPFGILNMLSGALAIFFGISAETSDFIADCLEAWWEANRADYCHIKELVINTDCGPNTAGNRTQFIKRMTEFADKSGLIIRLAYYPPYHSKYDPIERCWGVLEKHWNGEILDSIEKAIGWASTMTWKGIRPVVRLCDKIYEKGVTLTKKEMKSYEKRLIRSEKLPLWDIIIQPV